MSGAPARTPCGGKEGGLFARLSIALILARLHTIPSIHHTAYVAMVRDFPALN